MKEIAVSVCSTFNVDTKSAVSISVNCDIWSTIVEILALGAAAASVDCHLRLLFCWRREVVDRIEALQQNVAADREGIEAMVWYRWREIGRERGKKMACRDV